MGTGRWGDEPSSGGRRLRPSGPPPHRPAPPPRHPGPHGAPSGIGNSGGIVRALRNSHRLINAGADTSSKQTRVFWIYNPHLAPAPGPLTPWVGQPAASDVSGRVSLSRLSNHSVTSEPPPQGSRRTTMVRLCPPFLSPFLPSGDQNTREKEMGVTLRREGGACSGGGVGHPTPPPTISTSLYRRPQVACQALTMQWADWAEQAGQMGVLS